MTLCLYFTLILFANMPCYTSSNATTEISKNEPKIELVQHDNGTGKNCLICGSFVHMTRVSYIYILLKQSNG